MVSIETTRRSSSCKLGYMRRDRRRAGHRPQRLQLWLSKLDYNGGDWRAADGLRLPRLFRVQADVRAWSVAEEDEMYVNAAAHRCGRFASRAGVYNANQMS